jgi:hypothetical protein
VLVLENAAADDRGGTGRFTGASCGFAPGGKVDVGVVESIWNGINQESA